MYVAGHHSAYYSLTSFSAGPTYFNIGSTENGWEMVPTQHYEPVHDDAAGDAIADGIQQGQDTIITGTSIEPDLIKSAMYLQTPLGRLNTNVGLTLSGLAGPLVLTPIVGTPAATELGAGMSRIFYRAIIENDIRQLLGSKLRKIPVTFRCLPDPTEGWKVWDVVTTPSGVIATNPTGP